MAIYQSSYQTGLGWAKDSYHLFKTNPNKWLSLSLLYLMLFTLLPAIPNLSFLSYLLALMWPIFVVVAISLFRDADAHKTITISETLNSLKPKFYFLMSLGLLRLVYMTLIFYFFVGDQLELIEKAVQNKAELPELMDKITPTMLTVFLLSTPMLMATWFSPMLIAFNQYSLLDAIKSSIAGSIKYMMAISVGLIAIFIAFVLLIIFIMVLASLIYAASPNLANIFAGLAGFVCILAATSMMFAFQYVNYRDAYRAAPHQNA